VRRAYSAFACEAAFALDAGVAYAWLAGLSTANINTAQLHAASVSNSLLLVQEATQSYLLM
jgi:hypothetical protein